MNWFDEVAKEVAGGRTRREALRGLVRGLAGAALAGLGAGTARADPGGNSACAQWCTTIYPAGALRGKCVSDAAMCMSGNHPEACAVSLCYQCGPAAPMGHGALCGTSTLRFCCATGGNISTSACTSAGACSYTCTNGNATCDPNNPCGTPLGTTQNCSSCGDTCATGPTIAQSSCSGRACVYTCASGYAHCTSNPADVCETQLGTLQNCGHCGDACATGGHIATSSCQEGTCSHTCASGYATCDPSSPCGTNLNTDPNHCGTCGDACATGGNITGSTCVGGSCSFACASGYATCDPSSPCGTNTASDASNCGGCGDACATGGNITGSSCQSGACVYTCVSGYATCDTTPCGTQLGTTANCSGCGEGCAGAQICDNSRCCLPTGSTCNPNDSQCCGGCDANTGKCVTCIQTGDLGCTSDSQCCSGTCDFSMGKCQ